MSNAPEPTSSSSDHEAIQGFWKLIDYTAAGKRLANYLAVLTMETQIIARACGKSHVHNLEPDDLVALTVESAAMARVPLAGTNWIPGQGGY